MAVKSRSDVGTVGTCLRGDRTAEHSKQSSPVVYSRRTNNSPKPTGQKCIQFKLRLSHSSYEQTRIHSVFGEVQLFIIRLQWCENADISDVAQTNHPSNRTEHVLKSKPILFEHTNAKTLAGRDGVYRGTEEEEEWNRPLHARGADGTGDCQFTTRYLSAYVPERRAELLDDNENLSLHIKTRTLFPRTFFYDFRGITDSNV
ncbi:hypothetical protein CBL_09477 [Carabus blaptoides fortunei]